MGFDQDAALVGQDGFDEGDEDEKRARQYGEGREVRRKSRYGPVPDGGQRREDDLLHGDAGRAEYKSQTGDDRQRGQRFERHAAAGEEEGRQRVDEERQE